MGDMLLPTLEGVDVDWMILECPTDDFRDFNSCTEFPSTDEFSELVEL